MIGNKQFGYGYRFSPSIGLLATEPSFQKGSGLFSILSKGFKLLSPLIKKGANVVKKVVTSKPMKTIGKNLSDSAVNIAGEALIDVIEGNDPAENFQTNLQKARKGISSTLRQEMKRKINKEDDSNNIIPIPKKRKRNRNMNNKKKKSRGNIGTIL